MTLINKVVLISGASGGIGAATAQAFAKAGSRVAITSRRKEKMEAFSSAFPSMLVITADISDRSQAAGIVDRTLEHFGRIDILINNAASIIVTPSASVDPDDLESAFRTNLTGPIIATLRAAEIMKKQGGGHIINVGSPGFMMGIPFYAPYVCSKAAFSAWTRTIQAEWKDSEIRVSEYFPGYIKTDSKPLSRIGDIDQDFLMNPDQHFLARYFSRPKSPEHVARQLVRLAASQKNIAFSGLGVRFGTLIANFSSFRLSIASKMSKTARKKLGNMK